jgi:chorismate mutase
MSEIRDRIDEIDRSLSELLAARVRYAHKIGQAKQALGLPVYDGAREAAIAEKVRTHLATHALDAYTVPVLDIYRTLILVCRHAQDDASLDAADAGG